MKTKYTLLILSVLIFSNCEKKEHSEKTPEEILTQTPEVLEENASNYKLSSKRYNADVISKLYVEALEKNEDLKLLDEKIRNINSDSLNTHTKPFLEYSSVNNDYWTMANQYVDYLNDSILKQETIDVFKSLEDNYKESIKKHEDKLTEIRKHTSLLNDKLVLMKLMVSQSMMKNYQMNEKPDIAELETLLVQYEKLLKETEKFTKANK